MLPQLTITIAMTSEAIHVLLESIEIGNSSIRCLDGLHEQLQNL